MSLEKKEEKTLQTQFIPLTSPVNIMFHEQISINAYWFCFLKEEVKDKISSYGFPIVLDWKTVVFVVRISLPIFKVSMATLWLFFFIRKYMVSRL